MRISDWSSDVCSSDLSHLLVVAHLLARLRAAFADLCACSAGPRMEIGAPSHEAACGLADLCAVDQELHVLRPGVLAALGEAVRHRLPTGGAAVGCRLDGAALMAGSCMGSPSGLVLRPLVVLARLTCLATG